jgi:uncharacterized RDD family membrane protein YckC
MHRIDRHDVSQLFWAFCATVVMVFIGVAALGALEPGDAVPLTVAVLALAVLWLAHAWLDLWHDERR